MKTTNSYAQWYVDATAKLGNDIWRALMRHGGAVRYWIFYKPNGLEFTFAGEDERPEGFELATGEPAPNNLTAEQLVMWVRSNTGRVPVLPGDE